MNYERSSISSKDNFLDRQKQLNEQLCQIEKSLNKHNNHKDSHVPKLEELSYNLHKKNKIKGFRGRQSIFKRPEGPAPRSNIQTIPGYRRHPTKWTCYNLDDVSDMSNESNSEAAFSFLRELKQRKQCEKQSKIKEKLKLRDEAMDVNQIEEIMEEEEEELKDDDKKSITFRKPLKKKESLKVDLKPEFRNNKIIMPEYEVGTKKVSRKKLQKKIIEKIDKEKEMKLDHLQMYDDGEE